MGIMNKAKDLVRGQFLDVVEMEDADNLIVAKFRRKVGNDEIKQGSKVIVREGQCGVFIKGGKLADIFGPGTYELITDNFPVLSSLDAFPFLFSSPVIADLYFVSTRQFLNNKWATKGPIMKRDAEMNMVRLRAFGKFGFRINNVVLFMREVFGSMGFVMTYDIMQHLSSMVTETFADVIGTSQIPAIELASHYRDLSDEMLNILSGKSKDLGIEFSNVMVESISLPDEVEQMVDEQSGIGLANRDMSSFVQYNTTRAMRDAARQEGGLAGLGAGVALGNQMMQGVSQAGGTVAPVMRTESAADSLREFKRLMDEGIITEQEFLQKKQQLLGL